MVVQRLISLELNCRRRFYRVGSIHCHIQFGNYVLRWCNRGELNNTNARIDGGSYASVDFSKSNLFGVDLSAADLTGAIFTEATYNSETKWPEGFDPITAGAIGIGVNRTPIDLNFTGSLAFNENLPIGTTLAEFNASDPDGDS